MSTPWEIAMEIPSAHGLAADTFAHLCGGLGAYVLSTPEYFLLARGVELTPGFRCFFGSDLVSDSPGMRKMMADLSNPFIRYVNPNAWCIGVLAGDMVAAWKALETIGGTMDYVCWQDRRNGYRWRRTGPAFNAFLDSVAQRSKRAGNVSHARDASSNGAPIGEFLETR